MSKTLLETLKGNKQNKTPVWLMRQAGRYLPEYKQVRKNFSNFLEFCFNPEAAKEVTLQPLKRFDLDAAIIFSDILVLPFAMGAEVEFKEGVGPILSRVTSKDDLHKLHTPEKAKLEKVYEAISGVKAELEEDKTLIGFAGASWTVAAYMVEGKGTRDFMEVKRFINEDEETFSELINIVTDATILHLEGQIKAGADVVKIFDSWAGVLTEKEFKKWVVIPTKKIVSSLKEKFPQVPIIGFPRKSGLFYKEYAGNTGVSAVALDQFTSISWANKNLKDVVLQGNLDNVLLATNKDKIEEETKKILSEMNGKPFVFNLGHGVLPYTPVENVEKLIETVRKYG